MAVNQPPVLESDGLNDADEKILDELHDGRATPQLLAGRLDTDRSYVNQRLKRLVEHDHVTKPAAGLYELIDDPRKDTAGPRTDGDVAELRARIETLDAENDDLREQLEDCRERLAAADVDVDLDALRDDLSRALRHDSWTAVEDAAARLGVDDD